MGRPYLSDTMRLSIRCMAQVCGWIVLFRVLLAFLERWLFWLFPGELRVLFTGMLELSNGCISLSSVENTELRFLICAAMLSFGGLCVTMQTVSVTQGLRLRFYFPGKFLQTAVSVFLSWVILPKASICPIIPAAALIFILFFGAYLRKLQKNSSNPDLIGV